MNKKLKYGFRIKHYSKVVGKRNNEKKRFLEWLQLKNLSEKTLEKYTYYANILFKKELNERRMLNLLKKYDNPQFLTVLKHYLKFFNLIDLLEKIPERRGRQKYLKKGMRKHVTKEDVKKLLSGLENYSNIPERDKLMINILFKTGLRVGELVNLYATDVIEDNGKYYLFLRRTKAGFEQKQPITKNLYEEIKKYCEKNNIHYGKIFPVTIQNVHLRIKILSEKILGKRLHPHAFRRGAGTYYYSVTKDFLKTKKFLRHVKSDTTLKYVNIDEDLNLEEVFEK